MFVDPMEKKIFDNKEEPSSATTTILVILLCIFILGLGGMFGFYFFQYKNKARKVVVINENGDSNIDDSKSNIQSTAQ